MFFRNLHSGHCQAAGIRPQENVNLVLSQKLEYVFPRYADLAVVVIPDQPHRRLLSVAHGNAALSVDVRLPEANTLEGLSALEAEPSGQRNGQPDRNFCPVAHTLMRSHHWIQVIQHPVNDSASNRNVGPQRERPASDVPVTLEPPAPGPVQRRQPKFGLPNGFRKLVFLAARLALFCLLPVIVQKPQGNDATAPKYDPHTEAKMKGTVEEVRVPPKGSEKEIAHLLLKNGTEIVDVYLCPKSFLEEMGVGFSKGDDIAVTGSKVKQDGADLVLAREVVKGNDTLVLRDDKGNPVWTWQRKN